MLTVKQVRDDEEVKAIMQMSERQIEALGFTEHSVRHASIVSKWSGDILRSIGCDEKRVQLGEIAGYLHDIGNCLCRVDHAQSGALFAYQILKRMGMDYIDACEIMMAIGNHDEKVGVPVSDISAALIIADKADVHKSRVRKVRSDGNEIHDRVNLAAEKSYLTYEEKNIILNLEIDTTKCPVMDYFEIYFNRMKLCRRAAEFIDRKFCIFINGQQLL